MNYDFKFWQELAWTVAISFAVFALTAFMGSEDTTDWTVWIKTVLLGGARSVAGIIIAALTNPRTTSLLGGLLSLTMMVAVASVTLPLLVVGQRLLL